jgi:hypothetical protein
MHVGFTLTLGAAAIIVGVVWLIGLAVGYGIKSHRQKKARARMQAKAARIAAKAMRRAQRKKAIAKLLPWRWL